MTRMLTRLNLVFGRSGLFSRASKCFRPTFFVSLLLLTNQLYLSAGVIPAESPSLLHVRAAVASAVRGDVVVVPSGIARWNDHLIVTNRGITLQGAGIGQTIIIHDVPAGALLQLHAAPNQNTRLTGFEFRPGAGSSQWGIVQAYGAPIDNGGRIRIDHCKFEGFPNRQLTTFDAFGVSDNCIFNPSEGIPVYVYNQFWGGTDFGDGSWAAPTDWNSDKWWFVEDCTFNWADRVYAVVDAYRGARFVFRHNKVTNGWVEAHGLDSGGRFRSTRALQVYKNSFYRPRFGFQGYVNIRGGTALIFSNTTVTGEISYAGVLASYRSFFKFDPWESADGTGRWDLNAEGGPFATGRHTGTNRATVLVDSTKSWRTGEWAGDGYAIRNVTKGGYCSIIANSPTNITYEYSIWYGKTNLVWDTGDEYQIHRILRAMDQPGVGQGGLISGFENPTPLGWLNQRDDPVHSWGNTVDRLSVEASYIRQGINYIVGIPPQGFTPFTHPHPLRQGEGSDSGASIGSPKNPRVVTSVP